MSRRNFIHNSSLFRTETHSLDGLLKSALNTVIIYGTVKVDVHALLESELNLSIKLTGRFQKIFYFTLTAKKCTATKKVHDLYMACCNEFDLHILSFIYIYIYIYIGIVCLAYKGTRTVKS